MFVDTRPLTLVTIHSATICRLVVACTFSPRVRKIQTAVITAMTIHVFTTASDSMNQSF